jgi:tRNA/rRNA methyltransferase
MNVGAVCRVMANFGAGDLRLVRPCEDYKGADARRMALKAQPLLRSAVCYDYLEDALADRHLVIGATARRGKYRAACLTPRQMANRVSALAAGTRVGLLLGREDSGLSGEEIERCQTLVTIPTAGTYSALNLAQAAGVLLYELFLGQNAAAGGAPSTQAPALADQEQLEQLYLHMQTTLTRSGFLDPQNPAHLMRTFRRLFGRTELDAREVSILRGCLSSVDALMTPGRGDD